MKIEDFLIKYNSDYKKPTKYISFYSRSFCFFGHWFGKPTDITYEIQNAKYDRENDILEILLDQKASLKIKSPRDISDSEFELKIKNAEYILFEWLHFLDSEKKYFIKIVNEYHKCVGESNLNQNFKDLDIEKPAVLWKW